MFGNVSDVRKCFVHFVQPSSTSIVYPSCEVLTMTGSYDLRHDRVFCLTCHKEEEAGGHDRDRSFTKSDCVAASLRAGDFFDDGDADMDWR